MADFDTETKSPLPSTYEDEAMVNYGGGRVAEFKFNAYKSGRTNT